MPAPDARRTHAHAEIGRVLRRRSKHGEQGARTFEIADQLNAGRALLDASEREALIELDLGCGRRALESGAHASAVHYLEIAAELLPRATAGRRHPLWFAIELERARALSLDGRYAEGDKVTVPPGFDAQRIRLRPVDGDEAEFVGHAPFARAERIWLRLVVRKRSHPWRADWFAELHFEGALTTTRAVLSPEHPVVFLLGEELIVLIGRVMAGNPRIREIDLNPVIVHPEGEGVVALDALMLVD